MSYGYPTPRSFEITDKPLFEKRRQLIKQLSFIALGSVGMPIKTVFGDCPSVALKQLTEPVTAKKYATSYNNYYEFSTNKEAIRILAQELSLSPWMITISGEVEKSITLDVDAINKLCSEERIYRFRCVEGWSMVVPWTGVMLSELLKLAKPLSSARFVRFQSVVNPKEMIGQRHPTLDWPYQEALRMDEAMHPLTIIATGMYGDSLPPQNGAPLRLVVPWKYGYKSIKAVQKIELLSKQPPTTWVQAAPGEYGFYGNVNPMVAHPRWSQKREVPLGQTRKKPTLPFNGYGEQVAALYSGMDLSRHF